MKNPKAAFSVALHHVFLVLMTLWFLPSLFLISDFVIYVAFRFFSPFIEYSCLYLMQKNIYMNYLRTAIHHAVVEAFTFQTVVLKYFRFTGCYCRSIMNTFCEIYIIWFECIVNTFRAESWGWGSLGVERACMYEGVMIGH